MPILSTVDEVKRYIEMRISAGGSTEKDIFTSEAVDLIYRCSQGIPRLINNLCDNAMISAFLSDTRTIDREIIEEVAENLDLLPDRDLRPAVPDGSRPGGPQS
jgi:general secretion pathway protein A